MAKRFTDTTKYKKPFFRSLPAAYKLLWDFLYHDCDHSGIWIVDFETAQIYVGRDVVINKDNALRYFNSEGEPRIIELDNGKRWFIPSFIEFQYGKLTEKNRAHLNVIKTLFSFGLIDSNHNLIFKNKLHTSPLQGAKEQEQDKEEEKEQEKEQEPKGVQGENDDWMVAEVEKDLTDAFKPEFFKFIENENAYPNIDIKLQFKQFATKVRGSPDKYISHRMSGLRQAFQKQLRDAKPTFNKPNGIDKIISDTAKRNAILDKLYPPEGSEPQLAHEGIGSGT